MKVFQIATAAFREQISDTINRVLYAGQRFIVTKNGKPAAALVTIADYQLIAQLRAKANEQRVTERQEAMPDLSKSEVQAISDLAEATV